MNYQQAYDKIIQAYFRDEIKPYDPKFCFCGTLCDNNDKWFNQHAYYANILAVSPDYKHEDFGPYTGTEYAIMETALITTLEAGRSIGMQPEEYEERLFLGMTAALEVLKQIHRERGEDVDSLPALTKRTLTTI